MTGRDERAAASEQKSIDDQDRTDARFGRMEVAYITEKQLEEKCRGCHRVDNMRYEETTQAINRLAVATEKFEARMEIALKEFEKKLETYIPPVIHWVGELKTGALGFISAICIALIVYLSTQ